MMSIDVDTIGAKIRAGEPLADADIACLAETRDILALGTLADEVRRRRHGAETTFVRVASVRLPLAGDAVPECPANAREIVVGAGGLSFDAALEAIARVCALAGGRPVSAFSLDELEAASPAGSLTDLLKKVRDAGVASVASAALDRLADPVRSLEAVKAAGLDLARLAVHQTASVEDRLVQIRSAASIQRSLGWLRSFAPLGQSWAPGSPSTGFDDVRQVALARLCLAGFASIQVDWSAYGPKLAQVALTVGADDLDMVSPLDDTGEGCRRGPIEEVKRNITAAGLQPVERDGLWNRVGV